ncbi:hypothetical protein ACFSLT_02625 [Novosphingobium resinovorum]
MEPSLDKKVTRGVEKVFSTCGRFGGSGAIQCNLVGHFPVRLAFYVATQYLSRES